MKLLLPAKYSNSVSAGTISTLQVLYAPHGGTNSASAQLTPGMKRPAQLISYSSVQTPVS